MTQSAYDEIAEWYDDVIRSGPPLHALVLPCLFELIGDVQGQRICDLACGQGVIARQLARQGAMVVGVDLSAKLLEIAQHEEKTELLGIAYLHGDAQALDALADAAFDGVLCNWSLLDIPDLESCLRTVWRILRPQGWFVFSITHPCFLAPNSRLVDEEDGTVSAKVKGYFQEGFWRSDNPDGVRGRVGAYHRMLSTYLNTLVRNYPYQTAWIQARYHPRREPS